MPSFQPKLFANPRLRLIFFGEQKSSGERASESVPAYTGIGGAGNVGEKCLEFGFRWSADESKTVGEPAALKRSDHGGGGEVVNASATDQGIKPGWSVLTKLS